MLFNSLAFALFLPFVFAIYWFLLRKNLKGQNLFLLIASYFFYGLWDWRFLFLISFSTLLDYWAGAQIYKSNKYKRRYLWLSLGVNLGLLFVFKYFNFFISSWLELTHQFGFETNINTINIILPVGISFYTFQTLSYSIDIYQGKIRPAKSFLSFATFVAFFPQLVAGPIERAANLLPQIEKPRIFDSPLALSGIKLILWGFFKKVAIADSLAPYVNQIFDSWQTMPAALLLLGSILFAFQIYGDFSGYSDIAIGTSRLLGIKLMTNFKTPYFSRNIAEFWRRWHISLSTWFRDYLYIPLGGSRVNKPRAILNIFMIFLVSGFWHGANWTFLVWGGIHASLFLPQFVLGTNRKHLSKDIARPSGFPTLRELTQITVTFLLVTVAWVFFRADTMSQASAITASILNIGNYTHAINQLLSIRPSEGGFFYFDTLPLVALLICLEWRYRNKDIAERPFNLIEALILIVSTVVFGSFFNPQEFIYFQF